MRPEMDTLRPLSLVTGWLLALQGCLLSPVVAVLAQGFGAWVVGCAWIGISVPIDRQVWALVNQPNLAFAASNAAHGYWLASVLAPLAVSFVVLVVFPRGTTANVELLCGHTGWAMAVIGGAFIPLLDRVDGHLARWLHFADLPAVLVWLAPVAALPLAVLAMLRLVAFSRLARPHSGRSLRVTIVWLHLVVPTAAWLAVATLIAGRALPAACGAVVVIVAAVTAVAWFRYPRRPFHPPRELAGRDLLRAAVGVILLGTLVWAAGWPVGGAGRSALLWGPPSASNNLRAWIEPRPILAGAPLVPSAGRSSLE